MFARIYINYKLNVTGNLCCSDVCYCIIMSDSVIICAGTYVHIFSLSFNFGGWTVCFNVSLQTCLLQIGSDAIVRSDFHSVFHGVSGI